MTCWGSEIARQRAEECELVLRRALSVFVGAQSESRYTPMEQEGRPPRAWRREIYAAGKSKPVQQSYFFEIMSALFARVKAAWNGNR
jgi:hypothetical protein